jgi:hypothetical protein
MNFHEFDHPIELHCAPIPQWLETADLAASDAAAYDQPSVRVACLEVQFGPRTWAKPGGRFEQCPKRSDIHDPDDETGAEDRLLVPSRALGCEPRHPSPFAEESIDQGRHAPAPGSNRNRRTRPVAPMTLSASCGPRGAAM